MPNTASLNIIENDESQSLAEIGVDITGVEGETIMGPIGATDILIKSWPEFVRYYGGLHPTNDFPLICKRTIEAGSQLRVNRVVHYTTITDGTSISALLATTAVDIVNDETIPEELFRIIPIAQGAAYNFLNVEISTGSNGQAGYFDMRAWLTGQEANAEIYQNLKIPTGSGAANTQTWLKGVALSSYLIKPVYVDLTTITNLVPDTTTPILLTYTGGTNGGAIVAADYIGDPAGKNGFHAFDRIDDILSLGAPTQSTAAIHTAGTAYAENRKDLVYFAHLDNSLVSENAVIAAKDAMNIDSSYIAWFVGGLVTVDPLTSLNRNISELGDVMGVAAKSADENGPYISFANRKRGRIPNALGVVNNFGVTGNYNGMNLLANHQINTVIVRNNTIMVWGNFTGQLTQSLLSYLNVRRLLVYMKKSLAPLLEQYIEDPNTIETWKKMYMAVKPFFEGLITAQAIYGGWEWQGDQFAKNMQNLIINDPTAVSQGKYRVRAKFSPVPSLQEMELYLDISTSGISFEEAVS